MRKFRILQWIPLHVGIEGNKLAGSLANETSIFSIMVFDIKSVAKQKLCTNPQRKSAPKSNYSRKITMTIAILRTKHFKSVKILPNGSRTYVESKHCPGTYSRQKKYSST